MNLTNDLPEVELATYEHLDLFRSEAGALQLYLYLDPQRACTWLDWGGPPSLGVSPAMAFGVQLRYAIGGEDGGVPTGAAATSLLTKLQPLMQRVCRGHAVSGCGQDRVGQLDADAAAAAEELTEELRQHCWGDWDSREIIRAISVEEWMSVTESPEVADQSDAVLAVMADAICEAASAEEYHIADDVAAYLRHLRAAA